MSAAEEDDTRDTPSSSLLGENDQKAAQGSQEAKFDRRSTFARTLTFSPAKFAPLGGLQRTLTEIGNKIDPDAQYTNALIDQYQRHNEDNGDLPLQTGFARKAKFWKLALLVTMVSSVMGLVAAAFMNVTDEIPKLWVDCDYEADYHCGDLYKGQKWWVAVSGGAGLLVGLIRYCASYPRNLPGIFKDIHDFHTDPAWAPLTFLISLISLSGGATLGPEQALGNAGGGIATYLTQHLDADWFSGDTDYKSLLVLGGMTAPLGALFQAPFLGALMVHELGEPPKTFMESTTVLAIAAVSCFVVYYEVAKNSYIEQLSNKGFFISALWVHKEDYRDFMVATGFIIGVVSAALCLLVVVTIGATKQIFNRLRERLAWNKFLQEVLPPTLGGIIIGLVNYALPATVGNGNLENGYFIKYGGINQAIPGEPTISTQLLLCTGFARCFLLGVSMNCGFVGGVVFPFLTMGIIAGCVAYQYYTYIPLGLFISSFMVAIPCGIVPMPFTFTCLSAFAFFLGLNQTVPIFVAVITSYSLVCSTGLMKNMVVKSAERERKAAVGGAGGAGVVGMGDMEGVEGGMGGAVGGVTWKKEQRGREQESKEAEDFAMKHYLGKGQGRQSIDII